jgi:hypothetical protein
VEVSNDKKIIWIIALLTMISVMVAGCTSNVSNTTGTGTSETTKTAQSTVIQTSTQIQPPIATIKDTISSIRPPPSSPESTSRIATTIGVDKWTAIALDTPTGGIVKGHSYGFGFYVLTVPTNKKICGQWVNFYLDDKPAPGKWNIDPNPECWVSAQLFLSADETAQLSLGMHTLKVDYLGDTTYAPSHWEGTFNVKATASG